MKDVFGDAETREDSPRKRARSLSEHGGPESSRARGVWVAGDIGGIDDGDSSGIDHDESTSGATVVCFRTAEHLLSAAGEVWACGGGIGSLQCAGWAFEPGMLFGSLDKWWAPGLEERPSPHEGIDFVQYFVEPGETAQYLPPGSTVHPLLPGRVVSVFNDIMNQTVVVAHDTLGLPGEGGVALGGAPIRIEMWPRDKQLLTIYGHVKAAVQMGDQLNRTSAVLGFVEVRSAQPPSAPPTAHLHLSVAWMQVGAKPPSSWRDFTTSPRFIIFEPPTPTGGL